MIGFRAATTADFEFIFDLHKQSFGPYVDQVWGWDDEYQREYLKGRLVVDETQIIVADKVDIGRLSVEHRDAELFIGLIEITPDHQGRGIGGQVIQTLLDTAFAEGKAVALNVLGVNTRAYQLYRRLSPFPSTPRSSPAGPPVMSTSAISHGNEDRNCGAPAHLDSTCHAMGFRAMGGSTRMLCGAIMLNSDVAPSS
ncbi:GNAT family N-acetyltransferase [Mycobacterium branderi]|nr:GNAT family N-acetyltransferase [Mycobacterium branderi]MCV7235242.1 GNAT family N-acetyltransferase [Mycobacterium branderi]